jgi:hypothetical protein
MTTYILLVLIVLLFGCQLPPKPKPHHRHRAAKVGKVEPKQDLSAIAPLLRSTIDDGP